MQHIDLTLVMILIAECTIVALTLLFLFNLRKVMGLGLLFAALGVFQFMQIFLVSAIFYELAPGFIVTPASVVLFSASLFAVLLIYIKEGALKARTVIYALLIANIVMCILQVSFAYSIDNYSLTNPLNLSKEYFLNNARITLVGTLFFFLDTFLIIVLFEYTSRLIKPLFVRIFLVMTVVLYFDTILFVIFGHLESDTILLMIFSGLVSKTGAALIYSILFTTYMFLFEKENREAESHSFNDIFSLLTYRQKFEKLSSEHRRQKLESEKNLKESATRYKRIFDLSPICLCEIDVSEAHKYIVALKKNGVEDIVLYLNKNPQDLRVLISKMKILKVNNSTIELFDATDAEEISQKLYETFAENTLKFLIEDLNLLENRERTLERRGELKTLTGKTIYVHSSLSLISGEDVHDFVVLVAMRDISYRKISEDALKKSEAILKESQRVGKLGNWVLDLQKNQLYWSDEVYRIFELKPQEFDATNEGFLSLIHPDDREMVDSAYKQSLINRTPYQITHRLLMKDGRIKYVNERCETEYDLNGDPIRSIGTVNDITEVIKAGEKQKELAARNKLILDTTLDGFLLINAEGNIVDVNDAYTRMTGYTKTELQSTNFGNLGRLHHELEIVDRRESIINTGGAQFETTHKTKNGHLLEFNVSVTMMQYGSQNYYAVFCRDITRQKIVERELKESKEFLQNSINSALDGISILSKSGIHITINPSLCEMTGFSKEELIGTGPPHVYWPEEEYANIQRAFENTIAGKSGSHELIFKRKNGERFPAVVSPSPIKDENGKILNYIATVKDISQLKQLDNWKKLNTTILERATRGVSLDSIITEINQGVDVLIPGAISSILLVNGKNQLVNVGDSKLPEDWKERFDKMEIGPDSDFFSEAVYLKKRVFINNIQNDLLWNEYYDLAKANKVISCWFEPILSSDRKFALGTFVIYFAKQRLPSEEEFGFVESVSHILSIIIEKSKTEQELLNHRDNLEKLVEDRTIQLEKINKELESFSYSVSHDLRAPLTRINGFTKVLQDRYSDLLDDKGQHYLNRIRNSTKNMSLIIEDILALSKVGRQPLVTAEVDISIISRNILTEYKKLGAGRNVKIDIEPNLIVEMDRGLAVLMMENLLSNAWKFSSKCTEASIIIGSCEQENEEWIFVKDNGVGFEMTYYDQLFTPFHRLHTSDEFKGSGIGLATVRRIVDRHGGLVKAQSENGQGATFYFKI